MASKVYVGSRAPEALDINIVSATTDLRDVSAVALHLQPAAGTGQARTWSTSIVSAEQGSLLARHTYAADGSDLQRTGVWRLYAVLTVPGGSVRTDVGELEVVGRFG